MKALPRAIQFQGTALRAHASRQTSFALAEQGQGLDFEFEWPIQYLSSCLQGHGGCISTSEIVGTKCLLLYLIHGSDLCCGVVWCFRHFTILSLHGLWNVFSTWVRVKRVLREASEDRASFLSPGNDSIWARKITVFFHYRRWPMPKFWPFLQKYGRYAGGIPWKLAMFDFFAEPKLMDEIWRNAISLLKFIINGSSYFLEFLPVRIVLAVNSGSSLNISRDFLEESSKILSTGSRPWSN